jgi:hypothetical protein
MSRKNTCTKNLITKEEIETYFDFVDFFSHIYNAYKSLESCEDSYGALFLINNVFEDAIQKLMEFSPKKQKGKKIRPLM